jgi:glutamate synthase (NADPH/NADH) small chain
MAGVYAGGDIVTGAATVIEAMGAGRRAARSMKAYLGLSDPSAARAPGDPSATLFGLAPDQRNFVRLRVA